MVLAVGQARHLIEYQHPRRGLPWASMLLHATLSFFCLIVLSPLIWVLLVSFKSIPDGTHRWIWPRRFVQPLFGNYQWVLRQQGLIVRVFENSVLVTSGTVILATLTGVLGGYALTHVRTPGAKVILGILVASTFFPTRVTALIGIFTVQDRLGLINQTWGLMLPYSALAVAVSVFVMRGVFLAVPREIVDSARLDGAGTLRALVGILLPLVVNGIVVVIIINFTAAWGEYILAQTLMNDFEKKTMPVLIAGATSGLGAWPAGRVAALYLVAIAPGLVMFGFTQRWYMRGLQEGALRM